MWGFLGMGFKISVIGRVVCAFDQALEAELVLDFCIAARDHRMELKIGRKLEIKNDRIS